MRRPQTVSGQQVQTLRFFCINTVPRRRSRGYIIQMNVYKKSFIFEASNFEEYQDGRCIGRGPCTVTVVAKVMNDEGMAMMLQGEIPTKMNRTFGLPIFGLQRGDVLDDRIEYGRLPDSMCWHDPNEPIVCDVFNNMTCIRFAMLSPLRIVEFYGRFTDIRDY